MGEISVKEILAMWHCYMQAHVTKYFCFPQTLEQDMFCTNVHEMYKTVSMWAPCDELR